MTKEEQIPINWALESECPKCGYHLVKYSLNYECAKCDFKIIKNSKLGKTIAHRIKSFSIITYE